MTTPEKQMEFYDLCAENNVTSVLDLSRNRKTCQLLHLNALELSASEMPNMSVKLLHHACGDALVGR